MIDKYLADQDSIKADLNALLNPGFATVNNPGRTADIISEWHRRPTPNRGGKPKIVSLDHLDTLNPKIQNIIKVLRDIPFIGVYVHGSYANGTDVESSDLDLIYILPDTMCVDRSILLKIREQLRKTTPLFLKIDPLQHHGPYMLSQKMLQNYLECYLPIAVWESSRILLGSGNIKFSVVKSEFHNKIWFERSVDYYRRAAEGKVPIASEYDRKRFVCMCNMIPCVVYPWKTGEYTEKPKAMEWFFDEYDFTRSWIANITERRISNDYKDIEFLIKETSEICNRIKNGN